MHRNNLFESLLSWKSEMTANLVYSRHIQQLLLKSLYLWLFVIVIYLPLVKQVLKIVNLSSGKVLLPSKVRVRGNRLGESADRRCQNTDEKRNSKRVRKPERTNVCSSIFILETTKISQLNKTFGGIETRVFFKQEK